MPADKVEKIQSSFLWGEVFRDRKWTVKLL